MVWRVICVLVGGPLFLAGLGASLASAMAHTPGAGGSGFVGGIGLALLLLPFALRGLRSTDDDLP